MASSPEAADGLSAPRRRRLVRIALGVLVAAVFLAPDARCGWPFAGFNIAFRGTTWIVTTSGERPAEPRLSDAVLGTTEMLVLALLLAAATGLACGRRGATLRPRP